MLSYTLSLFSAILSCVLLIKNDSLERLRLASTHQEGKIGQERLHHHIHEACLLHGRSKLVNGVGRR